MLDAATTVVVLWSLTFSARPSLADEMKLPKNHVSIGFGLPIPVGGLVKLELLHRLDDRDFVKLGMGTAAILNGVYLSYGRRFSDDPKSAMYAFVGMDNNIILIPIDGAELLPGIHAGVGKEWLTSGGWRLAFGGAVGIPWLLGLNFEVGR
jgi:hypothetical protein